MIKHNSNQIYSQNQLKENAPRAVHKTNKNYIWKKTQYSSNQRTCGKAVPIITRIQGLHGGSSRTFARVPHAETDMTLLDGNRMEMCLHK